MNRCLGCMEVCSDDLCPHCGYTQGTPPKEIYHLKPGTVLYGKYTVGKVLGYGGFGVTYIGWDNILERKIAIKEFLPGDFSTRMPGHTFVTVYDGEATEQFAAGLERFTQEAQRLARFNGIPGIVGIYDTFTENNTGYIVMELLEGQTVKDLLRGAGVLPYDQADRIIKAVLRVLREVHKSGIIHRDISPDNIFITKNGEIKVIDFGAARYATTLHSKSLSVILKPGYAPEEQYRSRGNQGPWSDVYAVSATYYKMLTGMTIPEAMERVADDKLKPPSALGAVLPQSAENAIMNALIVDAEQRTQSADDFLRDLESDSVERVEEKRAKVDNGKMPLWLKITAGALAAVLVFIAALTAFGIIPLFSEKLSLTSFFSGDVQVPNVLNKTEAEASSVIETSKLTMTITGRQYNEWIEAGRVLAQTPEGGGLLPKYGTVEVLMSGGSEETIEEGKMPYVLYTPEAEARETLASLGITVEVTYQQSETVGKGLVMTQSIEEGAEIGEGAAVTLVVSSGPPPESKKVTNPVTTPNRTTQPDTNSQPITTQAPVVTQAPVATQAPVKTQAPIATQAPVKTQAPVATQPPVVTQAPTAPPVTTPAPIPDVTPPPPPVITPAPIQ